MTPLISVMMPCYNAAKTLPLALASLIAQTYTNWECVLVDDGSTDHPIEIVEAANDSRIRFFRFEENKGRGAARQYALDMAEGEYLCMLDADDWVYPWKLERQLQVMEANLDLAVLGTGLAIVDRQNELVGVRSRGSIKPGLQTFPSLKKPGSLPIEHAQCMVRMEAAKQARYDESLRLVEDNDYMLSILLCHPYGIISEITYVYTELESVTLKKILATLHGTHRILCKYRRQYSLIVYINNVELLIKEVIYRVGFALGFGERMLARRSQRPTAEMSQEFKKARHIVYQTGAKIFANSFYAARPPLSLLKSFQQTNNS